MTYTIKTSKKKLQKTTLRRKQSRKGKKTLKRKQSKKVRKFIKTAKQYGGDFNEQEIQILRQELQNMNFFTDNDITEIIKKLNLSSQRFAGPDFQQLIDQIQPGHFSDKEDFMDWLKDVGDEQEEQVETDKEFYDSDDEDTF